MDVRFEMVFKKGYKQTEEHKKNISLANKGRNNYWFKGKTWEEMYGKEKTKLKKEK